MADAGRTTWHPRDAAEHDRELVVELGEEFGAEGPYTITVLKDLAQQQRAHGNVRTGFRVLRTKTFVGSPERAREIVLKAAEIGMLDDLELDEDDRRFSCRVSGWDADQERGRASFRKAEQRDRDCDPEILVTVCHGESQNVTESPLPDQTRPDQKTTTGEVRQIFDAWVSSTERSPERTKLSPERRGLIARSLKSHGLADCLAAVRNIGASAWARGENDRQKRFDGLEHALKGAERIERWRDEKPRLIVVPDVPSREQAEAARVVGPMERAAGW